MHYRHYKLTSDNPEKRAKDKEEETEEGGPACDSEPLQPGEGPGRAPGQPQPPAPTHASEDGGEDDPEAFLDLFERTGEIWSWPRDQWVARLLPLLSGEAQLAAQQLQAVNLLAYEDLKKSILQRVGRSPEQYRQLFRSMKLEKTGCPFAYTQRLRDACQKWLLAGDCDVVGVVDQVVLEQLVHRLPRGMAEWVQCHCRASLEEAVRLAEDHMAAYPRAEEPFRSLSPHPVFSPLSLPPPFSLTLLSPQSTFLPRGGEESHHEVCSPCAGVGTPNIYGALPLSPSG
ncbi:zinc finger and SCAN domain-containing protein 21-like [Myxocyprinus asiaticus]|uniref:zinc finger and SCAN domain-containing protein 21-like n=1 Tax=Myxocyprinus asiaticus TaxID=70543 RepID=UPI0022219C8A|nr:zinc finger and SCAN domain-containing protein 21-like [Myxocyprinus asiaticus]